MNDLTMNYTGKIIKELREKKGESQEQLAEALQAPNRETIARWENGSRDLKREHIISIAKHFNVSTDYLLGLSDNSTTNPDITNACNTTGLNEEAVRKLNKYSKCKWKNLNKLIISYDFIDALDVLEKYCELDVINRKKLENSYKKDINGNVIIELPDLETPLTEEEKLKLDAQSLLEDYGYIVLESDYEILDFYKQRFISLISHAIDEMTQKDYADLIRRL